MKTLIISPKKTGNTYIVASHLARIENADLLILENGKDTDMHSYSHIVLCSGIYADKIHASLAAWLQAIPNEQFRKNVTFHVFLTWFGRGKSDRHAMAQIVKLLEEKKLSCDPDYGSCFGGMYFIRRGHPNEQDLIQAEQWMKQRT